MASPSSLVKPVNALPHAEAIMELALEMLNLEILYRNSLGVKLNLRIGIASGPVIAGVIRWSFHGARLTLLSGDWYSQMVLRSVWTLCQ